MEYQPNRIGIMGSSAGGHLASAAGTHFTSVMLIVNCQYRISGIQSLLGTIHVQSVAL